MRRSILVSLAVVFAAALGIFVFRAPIMGAVVDRLTRDMFVAADIDAFDPGVAVGEALPSIRALLDGREVVDVGEFMGARGLVLFANRSVDW